MLGCALEVPSLPKGKAMTAGEGLRSIAPHLEAAVIAAATLAIERSETMFDNRFMGHGGLLYENGGPLRLIRQETVPVESLEPAQHRPVKGTTRANLCQNKSSDQVVWR
jgi:hypothetical protein